MLPKQVQIPISVFTHQGHQQLHIFGNAIYFCTVTGRYHKKGTNSIIGSIGQQTVISIRTNSKTTTDLRTRVQVVNAYTPKFL
ncbi:hypothetical protein D3C86_1278990 [compost metagenome]